MGFNRVEIEKVVEIVNKRLKNEMWFLTEEWSLNFVGFVTAGSSGVSWSLICFRSYNCSVEIDRTII
jgi:hypothetical protein